MMDYSRGFKARMIERMAGPEQISATALAQEVGVSQSTLSRWLRAGGARRVEATTTNDRRGSRTWTAQEKLRLVHEASGLSAEELGAFLRRAGLHEVQLKEWTEAATAALSTTPKRKGRTASPEAKRIKNLERELHRKEKALAELAALLALQKKLETIWGDEGDGTDTRSGT
jgi:transposase-like protein